MNDVLLYAADVSCLNDPALYARAYRLADPERRKKADRFRFQRDRNLSLGAGLLLQYALHRAGFDEAPEIACDGNGKPFLKAPADLFFSLSHSGTMAVCALSEKEVGCDIERLGEGKLSVARRFFHPDEVAALEKSGDVRDFFRLWTCKESYLKCTGLGLLQPLDSFRVTLGDPPRLTQADAQRQYRLRESAAIPGYQCAVCTQEPCGEVRLCPVELKAALYELDTDIQ